MILILRPEPGACATLAAALELGLPARSIPLFVVQPLAWDAPAPNEIEALLLGSANALRHGGPALAAYRGLPAYCVGETTAQAARQAGLQVVATGRGGLQNLLAVLPPHHRRLLRLAGRERVDLNIPERVSITLREVYASEPLPMPSGFAQTLSNAPVALLHSGEAAARFAALVDEAGVDRGRVRIAAIGPRVAARAGTGWADLRSAHHPDDAALLALAQQMCQDVRHAH